MRSAWRGKTIGRTLSNHYIEQKCASLRGKVLDIAGGATPGYVKLLPISIELVRTDLAEADGVVAMDFNKPLPFPDNTFESVLLFNALYAVEKPLDLAREVRRVLKPGGTWLILSPFIANEMPEPHDYRRYTHEGLMNLLHTAAFEDVVIDRLGDRVAAAVQLLHPLFLFRFIRGLIFPLAILLDRAIPARTRTLHPAPVSYGVSARKSP